MPIGKSQTHTGILEYALKHLERERDEIQTKIEHVQKQLGVPSVRPAAAATEAPAAAAGAPARKKRVLSAAARKRIALAQKRRWAEHRKAEAKSGGVKTAAAGK